MDSLYFVVVMGAIAAGFVQGLSGFGFGLTAMSIWAWSVDPRLAAVLVVFGSLTGQIIAAVAVRRGFSWRRLAPFLIGGGVGIPIGVAILPLLDMQMFKAALGGFLVVWCPVMLCVSRFPTVTRGGRGADGLVGVVGGVMGGIGGFTGPAPTLWCTLRGFPKDEQRSVIQNFNLGALSVTMAAYVAQGIVTAPMLPFLAIVAAAMFIPAIFGARLYLGVSEQVFRKIVLALLTGSGVALLASSLPPLLAN